MHWVETLLNPETVRECYDQPWPNLVHVDQIRFHHHGPEIDLTFLLDRPPDRPTERMQARGFDEARAVLQLLDTASCTLTGWWRENRILSSEIRSRPHPHEGYSFRWETKTGAIAIEARFVRLDRIGTNAVEHPWPNINPR